MYQIRKRFLNMYNELFESEKEFNFDFNRCDIIFFIKNNKKYASFKCNGLSHLPRIGENVDVPFVRGQVDSDFFYVDDIRHSFEGKSQSIYIHLKRGMYNSYWRNRLHEAEVKREISLNEFFNLSDWELREKLLWR